MGGPLVYTRAHAHTRTPARTRARTCMRAPALRARVMSADQRVERSTAAHAIRNSSETRQKRQQQGLLSLPIPAQPQHQKIDSRAFKSICLKTRTLPPDSHAGHQKRAQQRTRQLTR